MNSPPVEVKRSTTEGVGVFATQAFLPGDTILRVRYEREINDASPLNSEAGERAEHCTRWDGKVMLVAFPGRHVNHSCDPNAYYIHADREPQVVARQAIRAGDEITLDYLINNPGGDSWSCNCGSARCRGETGTSFFNLPTGIQREYLPFLAPWFRKRYAERIGGVESG